MSTSTCSCPTSLIEKLSKQNGSNLSYHISYSHEYDQRFQFQEKEDGDENVP